MVSRTFCRRHGATGFALFATFVIVFASACDKVPLTAPSGSVITLFPVSTTVPLGGEVEIVATVIEQGVAAPPPTTPPPTTPGTPPTTPPTTPTTPAAPSPGAGTPVHNGTVVSFVTTLGRIEPSEARTNNGQVRVRLIAGNQSGTATITAFSGGASGRIENLRIGSAAISRVILSANPQTLTPSGGTTQVSARVEDANGLPVVNVPVTFSTTAGTITPNPAQTDQSGVAVTSLTTTANATVTASAGATTTATGLAITLNPRTGISITGPTTPVSAGVPVVFTVGVNATANIREVTIAFGDGSSQNLGAISVPTPVPHTYTTPDTYIVTARAVDASGFPEQVSTSIAILPAQPPSVLLTASDTSPSVGQLVTFTATVSGNTSAIQSFFWELGDGTTATTTSPQFSHSYAIAGTKVIRVTVTQSVGPSGTTQTSITVTP